MYFKMSFIAVIRPGLTLIH